MLTRRAPPLCAPSVATPSTRAITKPTRREMIITRNIRSPHEPEIRPREPADVGKHDREIARAHAEPRRERGVVLIHARARDPAAPASVVGPIDHETRHLAVDVAALNRASHDKLVIAPAVIGAAGIWHVGSTEIGCGEGGHL